MVIVFTFFLKYLDNNDSKINLNFSFSFRWKSVSFLARILSRLLSHPPTGSLNTIRQGRDRSLLTFLSLGAGHGREGKFNCEDGFCSWKGKKWIRSENLEQNKEWKKKKRSSRTKKMLCTQAWQARTYCTWITNHVMIARCQCLKGLGRAVPF